MRLALYSALLSVLLSALFAALWFVPGSPRFADRPDRLSGTYTGTYREPNSTGPETTVSFVFSEDDEGRISGNGSFVGRNSVAFTASGTRAGDDFAVTLESSERGSLNYAGRVSGGATVLDGTVTGSGYFWVGLDLTKDVPADEAR